MHMGTRADARLLSTVLVVLGAIGTGCSPGAPAGSPHSGYVYLSQVSFGATMNTAFGGIFVDAPLDALLRAELPGCTVLEVSGACRAVRCMSGTSTLGVSAGTLTASVDGTEILTAMTTGAGYSASRMGTPLAAGSAVSVTATGGIVPAFAASTTVPEAPVATLPTAVTAAAPLTVSWTATVAAEDVVLSIVPTTGSGGVIVTCRGPASTGSYTIPSSLLSQLADGPAIMSLATYNTAETRAGTYDVAVAAAQVTGSAVSISR